MLNNSSVNTSSSLFEAISIFGILIVGDDGDAIDGLGCLGMNCTLCPLLLDDGVGAVAQAERIVVVDGVGEITEFCLLGGPNAGKSS